MQINKLKTKQKKTCTISIRITKQLKNWLNHNQLSPTRIFHEACKEIGYQRGKQK